MTQPVGTSNVDAGAIVAAVRSRLLQLGIFDRVNGHEPIGAPGNGVTGSVWLGPIRPDARRSGLSTTSAVFLIMVQIWITAQADSRDDTEVLLAAATSQTYGSLIGGFQLADEAGVPTGAAIDIFGMSGTEMDARPGYAKIEGTEYRVQTITVPVLVNNVWDQAA